MGWISSTSPSVARFSPAAANCGIPAITAAPIGMGVGYLVFTPAGLSFEDYFRMEGRPQPEQFLRFLMGLVPRGLHRRYLVDPTRINLAARKGPSTAAAVQLCAGVTAAAAVKLLLGRGGVKAAPWHHHFDAYLDRLVVTRLAVRPGRAGAARQTCPRAAHDRARCFPPLAGPDSGTGPAGAWTPSDRRDPQPRPLGAERRQRPAVALPDHR